MRAGFGRPVHEVAAGADVERSGIGDRIAEGVGVVAVAEGVGEVVLVPFDVGVGRVDERGRLGAGKVEVARDGGLVVDDRGAVDGVAPLRGEGREVVDGRGVALAGYEIGVEAISGCGSGRLFEHGVPAGRLHDRDTVFLLQFAYGTAHLHARSQGENQILVQHIYLGAELAKFIIETLVRSGGIAHHQTLQQADQC